MSEWVQCHAMHLRVSWAVWPCWTYTVSCSAVKPYSTLPSASTHTYMRINFIVQDDGGPDSHGFCFLNNISIGTYVRKNVRTYARTFVCVRHRMQSCFVLCGWVSWVFYPRHLYQERILLLTLFCLWQSSMSFRRRDEMQPHTLPSALHPSPAVITVITVHGKSRESKSRYLTSPFSLLFSSLLFW